MFTRIITTIAATVAVISAGPDVAPIDDAKRTELIAKWRAEYDSRIAKHQSIIEKAAPLLTNSKTAADGRSQITVAKNEIAKLKKDPFSVRIREVGPMPASRGLVVKCDSVSCTVDVAHQITRSLGGGGFGGGVTSTESVVSRYLLIPAPSGARPKTKIDLPGLWYFIPTKIDDKVVIKAYPLGLRKEDLAK